MGPQKKAGEGESLQEIYFWMCGSEPWARGPQGEEEAGLENLVFNSKFPQPWGWQPQPA